MSETLLFDRGTIHQGDERFNSLSRGRQCCFMSLSALLFDRLCSSVSCRWTAENVDHILSVGDSMYLSSLQEGVTPDTTTLSINNLPKSVRWIAESSEAILDLSTSRTRNQVRPTLANAKIQDRPTLVKTSAQYITFDE